MNNAKLCIILLAAGAIVVGIISTPLQTHASGHYECKKMSYSDTNCNGDPSISSYPSPKDDSTGGCNSGVVIFCTFACDNVPNPGGATTSRATLYKCKDNSCGGTILSEETSQTCTTNYYSKTDSNGCVTDWILDSTVCDPATSTQKTYSTAGTYQICPVSGNNWASTPPSYQCSGTCYPKPEIKPLNDPSLSPQNVFEDPAKTKVKLPVNIGISDSFSPNSVQTEFANESCTIDSYHYEITGGPAPVTGNTPPADRENFIASCTPNLNPSQNYSATAQACFGGTCGAASNPLKFLTSDAPELKSPYDPDWEQNKRALAIQPVTLSWCSAPDAKAYSYAIYQDKVKDPVLQSSSEASENFYNDQDQWQVLKNGIAYLWEVSQCSNADATACGAFSQRWSFVPQSSLGAPILQAPAYSAGPPEVVPSVNLSDSLSWTAADPNASFFLLHVQGPATLLNKDYPAKENTYSLNDLWQDLAPDTLYSWKVAECAGTPTPSNPCLNQGKWSDEWKFQTTGAKPTGLTTKPLDATSGTTAIPATLDWNDMPAAASYAWEVTGVTSGVATNSEATTSNLQQGTTYPWRVKTCADVQGKECGNWSMPLATFTTATLASPAIVSPQQAKDEVIPNVQIKWDRVFSGNFYTYGVKYIVLAPDETSSSCKSAVGAFVDQNTISQNSASVRVRCMGEYQLQVSACVDETCSNTGPLSTQSFTVKEPLAKAGGLVPCARSANNPSTPWDDREPCQIKHIFLLIKTLLDFALWRLAPIFAMLYAVATGVLLYFSLGDALTLAKIKSIWRAFGIGVLIIFFAWLFLNILLGLLGFNINFYGRWYQIPL